MYSYSVTINPSAHKKWNKQLISMAFDMNISAASYAKLPREIQKNLLRAIEQELKNLCGGDWYEPRFEYTANGNLHMHTMFALQDDIDFEKLEDIIDLNSVFSSGVKHPCLFFEQTYFDTKFWEKYMNKDVLFNCEIPEDSPLCDCMDGPCN